MPAIISKSISILSDAGLGMAMFSLGTTLWPSVQLFLCCAIYKVAYKSNVPPLFTSITAAAGLFMALQPRIIACGNRVAGFTMAVRFLIGPAVMAAASLVVGLRGPLLHVAIVQVIAGSLASLSCY